jgi:hypothetical protein
VDTNHQTQRPMSPLTMTYIDRTIFTYRLAPGALHRSSSFGLPPGGKTLKAAPSIGYLTPIYHPGISGSHPKRPFSLLRFASSRLHQLQSPKISTLRRAAPYMHRFA